jgi:uncharacterized protein YndB with AHSA1/START domain
MSNRTNNEYGVVTEPGTVRIERLLPGPIERIWAYLTEGEKRAKWFAGGEMELRAGGKMQLIFEHANLSAEKTPPEKFKKFEKREDYVGRVTQCDPPRLLSFTMRDCAGGGAETEATFELTPVGRDVRVVVTHRRLPDRDATIGVASGWHTHLGILEDVLNDDPPRGFWSTHAKLAADYEKRVPGA